MGIHGHYGGNMEIVGPCKDSKPSWSGRTVFCYLSGDTRGSGIDADRAPLGGKLVSVCNTAYVF